MKNPVGFDPTTFKDRALARRNVVLNRMAELNVIAPATAQQLTRVPLGLKVSKSRNGCLGTKAPFFCDYVRRYLLADPSLGKTVADRAQLLNSGGLTIKTTVDLRLQRAADKATDAAVNGHATRPSAPSRWSSPAPATCWRSPSPGRWVASSKKGQTFLNYVVDSKYGDSNGFQAGSTFKVFVLAAALEQGLPTSTRFNSPRADEHPAERLHGLRRPLPGDLGLEPGQLDRPAALQHVHRHPAVGEHLLRPAGAEDRPVRALRAGQGHGRRPHRPDHERVPSFTLGVADVSPLEMAGAYATFAARGKHCDNRPVTQILNSDGKVFKNYPKQCKQVMQESTADTVNDILRGVIAPGGFGQALALNKPSAGKTGTINSNMAVWFNGYTPDLATAAMIAGANQQGQPITLNGQTVGGRIIGAAFGSTVAGPMWAQAMRAVQDDLPDETSPRPSGRGRGPDRGGDPRRRRPVRRAGPRRSWPAPGSTSASVNAATPTNAAGTVAETSPPRRRPHQPRVDGHAVSRHRG